MISQSEAARICKVSRQAINKICKQKKPPDFVIKKNKKIMIDEKRSSWKRYAKEMIKSAHLKAGNRRAKSTGQKIAKAKSVKSEKLNKKTQKLIEQATEADCRKRIHEAVIAEEKAKQQEIKTLQLTKELAPLSMMKHWFSFAENMIQQIYRRPHEISPELEALYRSGESKKAVQKIIRELEAIIKNTVAELQAEIKNEGYKVTS